MKLSIKDRLSLHNLFPQQGTLLTQIMIKELKEKTKIPAIEADKVGLKQEGQI